MKYAQAFEILIDHEGGYVNDPNDPGGETKWGISKRSYPALDIKNLTRADAKAIYYRDFWAKMHCHEMPGPLRFDLLDGAVHSGPEQATRWLQRAIGASDDGIIGPITLGRVQAAEMLPTLMMYQAARLLFMSKRSNWPHHGKNWATRMAKNIYRNGHTAVTNNG